MTRSKTDRQSTPVPAGLDSEVIAFREQFEDRSSLDELVREGARRMLQEAINSEVSSFIELHRDRRDEAGRRLVVLNGSLPARKIMAGAGPIEVTQGRVRDNSTSPQDRVRFSPTVLLAYLRRTEAIEELLPWLYLKGISTGDFAEALQTLVVELRRPRADMLRDGVYELRTEVGNVNYRILYGFVGKDVAVLACGLTKEKTVPAREIDRAAERVAKYKQNPTRHRFEYEDENNHG